MRASLTHACTSIPLSSPSPFPLTFTGSGRYKGTEEREFLIPEGRDGEEGRGGGKGGEERGEMGGKGEKEVNR